MKRNYKDDFNFILRLKTRVKHDDGTCSTHKEIGWPEYDWTAVFWTDNRVMTYTASCKGGMLTNCVNDGGHIRVILKKHRLSCGRLKVEFHSELPDELYADGVENRYNPQPLDIELVDGPGDCPTDIEVELMLPYIKGDKMTYSDLTEADKEDLRKPLLPLLDKKQDKLNFSEDFTLSEQNGLSVSERAKREVFDEQWLSLGGGVVVPGQIYSLNGLDDLTFEDAFAIVLNTGHFVKLQAVKDAPITINGHAIRTNFGIKNGTLGGTLIVSGDKIEVLKIDTPYPFSPWVLTTWSFSNMSRLRSVIGIVTFAPSTHNFKNIPNLQDIRLEGLRVSINLGTCQKLSFASMSYMVTNSANTSTITITVHPDVYAKITDPTNTEWHALIAAAQAKNISFATV